jgi:predicted phosphoribosyltransferase
MRMITRFRDRVDAGRVLARKLDRYRGRPDLLVLALPRGGVPVGFEVARELGAPLDVFVVRKLGMPGHEEYAIGAIASGGVRIINEEAITAFGVTDAEIEAVTAAESAELERRERRYRDGRPPPEIAGKTVILVDDGLATGSTMRAAVEALREEGPARLVVAVPTAAPETCHEIGRLVDDMVCAMTPEPFYAVGLWYDDFGQTTDEEVHDLLALAAGAAHGATRS